MHKSLSDAKESNDKDSIQRLKEGLLCWAEPFGFGPSATLNLFTPYLPSLRDFAGTAFTCDLQNSGSFRRFLDCDTILSQQGERQFRALCRNYSTVFIVCDFKAAELSLAEGCKTILYDPMPWFWRDKLPEICHQVDAYICQDFFGVRKRLDQEKVANAVIVPPLFPPHDENAVKTGGVLVNLGGLQNPFMHLGQCQDYAQLILDQIAESSDKHNLGQSIGFSSRAVVEGVRGRRFFSGKPDELRKWLAGSRLAFMTPGLGNIFEAAVLGKYVCFLPPANDSQGLQLHLLRRHGLAPFSIDWHEILEETAPINYAGKDQEKIIGTISDCLQRLIQDSHARQRFSERIQAFIEMAAAEINLPYEQPLSKLVQLFGNPITAEEKVGSIVHRVVSQEMPVSQKQPAHPIVSSGSANSTTPIQIPSSNEDIEDPTSSLMQLHRDLNGKGFHTLSYLLDFLRQVNKNYGDVPLDKHWKKAVDEYNPDPAMLLAKYGSSYCTPIAELLLEHAQNKLGIKGKIVYVDYRDSKRPLQRIWPDYRGPVHADAVFHYKLRGSLKTETIHVICGLGSDSSRFKYFEEIDDHKRFLVNENYSVDDSGAPQQAADRRYFYQKVLRRWNLVEIVKGPKINKDSSRFSVDMISGAMSLKSANIGASYPLDWLLAGGEKQKKAFALISDVMREFAQPECFIESMVVMAKLRGGFTQHVLMNSRTHLEDAFMNLARSGLDWIERFKLNPPGSSLAMALENFFHHPGCEKAAGIMRFLSKASKIWLGMQTKAPAQRDLDIFLLQGAVMMDYHAAIQREAILKDIEKGKEACLLLQERFGMLPQKELLTDLADKSGVFTSGDESRKFVECTRLILIDHLLLGFVEAGIAVRCNEEDMKIFADSFVSLVNQQPELSKESRDLLTTLLNSMLNREISSEIKLQAFPRHGAVCSDQIDAIESYYWQNIPVRALLRQLPESARAFSVASQAGIFEDAGMLKALLLRHSFSSSPEKKCAGPILDSLFNREIMALVQRYAGVGLGPQLIAICIEASRRCGMTGCFKAEALVGFEACYGDKPGALHINLEFANRIAHQPVCRSLLAKQWGLPASMDAEGVLNHVSAENINAFFRSRYLGQFLASAGEDLVDIMTKIITSNPSLPVCHQRPTLQRRVDRAVMALASSNGLQAALAGLRQSVQWLSAHPFGLQAMQTCDWSKPIDSLDGIVQWQSAVDRLFKIADCLWEDRLRKETGSCLTQGMRKRLGDIRSAWIEKELPFYEPNCAISVVPHTFTKAQELSGQEKAVLSFYERVRMLWQDPFGIVRILQRLVCLLEIRQQVSGDGPIAVLEQLLEEAERKMGLGLAVNLDKGFSPQDFYAILRNGSPFNDLIFLSQPHGSRIHRLQWLMLYLVYLHTPEELGLSKDVSSDFLGFAYRMLGDETLIRKLGYPLNQTMEDIWRLLFDNLHQRNFSCADHVKRVLAEYLGFDPDEAQG